MQLNDVREQLFLFAEQFNFELIKSPSEILVHVVSEESALNFVLPSHEICKKLRNMLEDGLKEKKRMIYTQACVYLIKNTDGIKALKDDVSRCKFSEFLCNYSFGYSSKTDKADMCSWAFDFVVNTLKIDKSRLVVHYFGGTEDGLEPDEDTRDIWLKLGIKPEKIVALMGMTNMFHTDKTGPCGPCTSMFVSGSNQSVDDPALFKIWNLISFESHRCSDGTFRNLPNHFTFTSMALEAIVSVVHNQYSLYCGDIFKNIFQTIEELSGVRPYLGRTDTEDADGIDKAYRFIAEVTRSISVFLKSGVKPSHLGQGAILRKLVRQALSYGAIFFNGKPGIFSTLVDIVRQLMEDTVPDRKKGHHSFSELMKKEEEQYMKTLQNGQKLLNKEIDLCKKTKILPGDIAWRLVDTHGLPIEQTMCILKERGISIDFEGFERAKASSLSRKRKIIQDHLQQNRPKKCFSSTDIYVRNVEHGQLNEIWELDEEDLLSLKLGEELDNTNELHSFFFKRIQEITKEKLEIEQELVTMKKENEKLKLLLDTTEDQSSHSSVTISTNRTKEDAHKQTNLDVEENLECEQDIIGAASKAMKQASGKLALYVARQKVQDLGVGTESIATTKATSSKKFNESVDSICQEDPVQYVGILNQGATCYLNVLIQTLYFTNIFKETVFKILPLENRKVTKALQRVFYELQFSKGPVDASILTRALQMSKEDCFVQHDVQEVCRQLLDLLQQEISETSVGQIIPKLFTGKIIYTFKCSHIDYSFTKEEHFLDLQLQVKGLKNVKESLDELCKVEKLVDKYDAGKFGLQELEKAASFEKFPPILYLQLMRFEFDSASKTYKKINDRFEFSEKLCLDTFLQGKEKSVCYTIHCVISHSGEINQGHYTAFINPKADGQWYQFNDERVTRCRKEEALEENFDGQTGKKRCAYMLAYFRDRDLSRVKPAYSWFFLQGRYYSYLLSKGFFKIMLVFS